jgi:hypothetical protein
MHYELRMAFAAISPLSDARQPDRRRRTSVQLLARRGWRRSVPAMPVVATLLLRTGPER